MKRKVYNGPKFDLILGELPVVNPTSDESKIESVSDSQRKSED
jgi:hypothetical protein